MHPVIRIAALVVLAAGLARTQWLQLVPVALVLCFAYWRLGVSRAREFVQVARRLKFLFLSIAVVYLWFTPGPPLVAAWGDWSPSWPGLEQGLLRVSALLLLVAAVQLLILASSRSELLAAIRWWAQPLRLLGLSADRLALRMVLTLEAVPRLREAVLAKRPPPAKGGRWGRIAGFAGSAFSATVAAAESAECGPVSVPALERVPVWQWLLPLVVAVPFLAI